MNLMRQVRAAYYAHPPSTDRIVELIRNPDVPLSDKATLLRRLIPNATEEQAWDVAMGADVPEPPYVCAECEEPYTPEGLDEGLCPDCQQAWEDEGDGEATITGPPVHPLTEGEKALVERAKRERLDLDALCRDPWGELWMDGAPLWAVLAPDDGEEEA